MSTRRKAREAWHDRELLATATFTWPVQEQQKPYRPDPARDPEYPYRRAWERQELTEVDSVPMAALARFERERQDDFDPNSHDRWLWLKGVPAFSGEGAIYSPEHLERTQGPREP